MVIQIIEWRFGKMGETIFTSKNAMTVLSNIDKTRLNGFSEKCNDCENNEIKWEIK